MEPDRLGHRPRFGSLIGTVGARASAWWRNLVHRTRVEDDLDEEVRSQLELLVDDHVSRGLPRAEAERLARLEFGAVEQVKDAVRSIRTGHWLDEMVQDVRYGCRSLLRTPLVTLAATLTIALGIGVNTAMFLIVNGVAFRPFTVPSGDPVLSVSQRVEGEAARSRHIRFERTWVSYAEYDAYRHATHSLTGLAAYAPNVTATLAGEPPRILTGALTSCNFFDVLEARMALGRGFLSGDCAAPGTSDAVVLSDDIWRSTFGSDEAMVGRAITLNRRLFTVIGITSAGFRPPGPIAAAFWAPVTSQAGLMPNQRLLDDPRASWLALLARPRYGIDIRAVRAELAVMATDLDRRESARHTRLVVDPARMFDMPQARTAAIGLGSLLLGAVERLQSTEDRSRRNTPTSRSACGRVCVPRNSSNAQPPAIHHSASLDARRLAASVG